MPQALLPVPLGLWRGGNRAQTEVCATGDGLLRLRREYVFQSEIDLRLIPDVRASWDAACCAPTSAKANV